jgi:FixJ family two-component response regulator
MSGHADIRMSVRAMKAGTPDFSPKPFRDQDMLDTVLAAISGDRGRKLAAERKANLKARYELLSARKAAANPTYARQMEGPMRSNRRGVLRRMVEL